jgi:hypothetical protein
MRTISIITNSKQIPLQLCITPRQEVELQALQNQEYLIRILVEIALHPDNQTVISEAVAQNKTNDVCATFLQLALADLPYCSMMTFEEYDALRSVGDCVILEFGIKNGRIRIDLESVGLRVDERGRLQLLKTPVACELKK